MKISELLLLTNITLIIQIGISEANHFVQLIYRKHRYFTYDRKEGAIKKRKRSPVGIWLSVSNFIILGVTSPFLAKSNKFIHLGMCATPFNYSSFSYVIESTYFHSTALLSIRNMQIHSELYTNR